MSGQPLPTKLVEPFAKNAPVGSVAGGKTVPFPVPSQIPLGQPGEASLDDGFTVLNMTPLTSGGLPMSGPNLNGILYLYGTLVAAVSAGQAFYPFDATYAATLPGAGYAVGAILCGVANPLALYMNTLDGNATDPEVDATHWYLVNGALHSSSAPSAGTHADNTLSGPSDYFVDVDTTAGAITLNGFVKQRDGQRITISNTGANALVIGFGAGTAANQIRANGASVTLLQNDSLTIQYSTAIGKWVVV
jgi:hypothetical protein